MSGKNEQNKKPKAKRGDRRDGSKQAIEIDAQQIEPINLQDNAKQAVEGDENVGKQGDVLKNKQVDKRKNITKKHNTDAEQASVTVLSSSTEPAETPAPNAKPLNNKTLRQIKKARRKKGFIYEVSERIKTDPKTGLNEEQVAARTNAGLVNVTINKNKKTYMGIVLSNLLTFFNLLSFLVAGALIAVGAANNVFFLVIVCANILIGIIQECRAKRTIDKISLITAPSANVIRNGQRLTIPIEQLVIDDIVLFTLGDQISADCIVLSGQIEANESLLTGEPNAIKKATGDTLLGGSFVASGNCVARVEKVAGACYTTSLAEKAKRYAKPKSELLGSLKLIIKIIGVIIVPLGILMWFSNSNFLSGSTETVKKTAGAIMGMIPAGMFLLTSMALAVGAVKLARKRAYVQDLYSIEMLARIDTLCLDKTGTLTDGTMKVTNVVKLTEIADKKLKSIFGSMLKALDNNNQTSQALTAHFGRNDDYYATGVVPFSSDRKFSAVTLKGAGTYAFGAPEYLMKTANIPVAKLIKEYSAQGQRVLIIMNSSNAISGNNLPSNMKPVALLVIQDHIREDAAETIKWFTDNSVRVRIISGDNPITVSEVSRRVGVPNAEKYISLAGMSDQQVIESAGKYTVFGRVSPEQKAVLVRALKAKGQKVAMTGDGVNDILALKEADCSIAMASGSEAARSVSHLILLDSNFQSLPSVVTEGRRVINNVAKSSSLFLMKTLFVIMLATLTLALGIAFPFAPNQLLMLELFAIGIPSFFLALQPSNDPIKGKFLLTIIQKSLPGAIIFIINFAACYVFSEYILPTGTLQYETMASYAITLSGLIMLFAICRPLDIFRGILFGCMLTGVTIVMLAVPIGFFEYVKLTTENLLFTIITVQLGFVYLAYKKPNIGKGSSAPPVRQTSSDDVLEVAEVSKLK